MNTTKGTGSLRDSLVGLIVPGLLMTALVGVLVVKWPPAQATEPAPLPPGTLGALHREAVKELAAETRDGHEASQRTASKGRVGDRSATAQRHRAAARGHARAVDPVRCGGDSPCGQVPSKK